MVRRMKGDEDRYFSSGGGVAASVFRQRRISRVCVVDMTNLPYLVLVRCVLMVRSVVSIDGDGMCNLMDTLPIYKGMYVHEGKEKRKEKSINAVRSLRLS